MLDGSFVVSTILQQFKKFCALSCLGRFAFLDKHKRQPAERNSNLSSIPIDAHFFSRDKKSFSSKANGGLTDYNGSDKGQPTVKGRFLEGNAVAYILLPFLLFLLLSVPSYSPTLENSG
jgi:hypothetical protein